MNKKDLIISVLATFCLTATLFIILPSRSAEPYNPWGDVSGPTIGEPDGTINMRDINYEILRFNTFGDTAKNVTVANWPSNKLAYSIETSVGAVAGFESPYISVAGYSKISICIWNDAAQDQYWLYARHRGGWDFTADYAENMPNNLVKTYDAPNEEIRVRFFNHDAGSRNLKLDVYLIP